MIKLKSIIKNITKSCYTKKLIVFTMTFTVSGTILGQMDPKISQIKTLQSFILNNQNVLNYSSRPIINNKPNVKKEYQTIIKKITIQKGQTLSHVLSTQGIDHKTIAQLAQTPKLGKKLNNIHPQQIIKIIMKKQTKKLNKLIYYQSPTYYIAFTRKNNGFEATPYHLVPTTKLIIKRGTIKDSLYMTALNLGMDDNLIYKFMQLFAWDIDYREDIYPGDKFAVIYEEQFIQGQKIGHANIIAAYFINRGQKLSVVRYKNQKGDIGYYTLDGSNIKKAFLRNPVDFTRISSQYNPNRLHPIYKTLRPHRGVDYAAPIGTPIKASGTGKIKFIGWQNGYGNVIYIQHPENITTVYAHQSKFRKDLKVGDKVSQGEIIGYVGQTGWATGPHLHYEFRVNDEHRNPITVKLPNSNPVHKNEYDRFKESTQFLIAKLDQNKSTLIASNP